MTQLTRRRDPEAQLETWLIYYGDVQVEHHRANLRENIQPTRTRADVVLRKRSDHSVGEVWSRET
jgi:hypothetical protein